MRAGALDRRVSLQRRRTVRVPGGGTRDAWSTAATVWAERRDVRGRERVAAGAEVVVADAVFRIRWRPGITPEGWRLVEEDGGAAWDLDHVAELGRRDALELVCRRVST